VFDCIFDDGNKVFDYIFECLITSLMLHCTAPKCLGVARLVCCEMEALFDTQHKRTWLLEGTLTPVSPCCRCRCCCCCCYSARSDGRAMHSFVFKDARVIAVDSKRLTVSPCDSMRPSVGRLRRDQQACACPVPTFPQDHTPSAIACLLLASAARSSSFWRN